MTLFTGGGKNSKNLYETTKDPDSQTILHKNKTGGITMPDFKTFYNAMVTKQACNSHKKK
jgi:hypothetical protein